MAEATQLFNGSDGGAGGVGYCRISGDLASDPYVRWAHNGTPTVNGSTSTWLEAEFISD